MKIVEVEKSSEERRDGGKENSEGGKWKWKWRKM